jgi:hypothetical protein
VRISVVRGSSLGVISGRKFGSAVEGGSGAEIGRDHREHRARTQRARREEFGEGGRRSFR